MPVKEGSNGRTVAIAAPIVDLKSMAVEKGEFMQGAKAW
jgi:hypothetical protein